MKWNVGTKIGLGFALVLIIFVIVGVVAHRNTEHLIDTTDLQVRSYEVTKQLEDILTYATDIEYGARGYLLTGEEVYLEPYQAALGKFQEPLARFKELTLKEEKQQERHRKLLEEVNESVALSRKSVELRRSSGADAALVVLKSGDGEKLMNAIRSDTNEMKAAEKANLEQRTEAAQSSGQTAQWTITIGTTIAAILAAGAGLLLTTNIAGPLRRLTNVAEKITDGDLKTNIEQDNRADEVGMLSRTFERMSEDLRGQLRQLTEGVNVLGSAAAQIVASTAQFAASASESAAAVSETTTTVEEVRQTAQLATQKARLVSDSSQRAAQISQTGRKSTEDANAGMTRIRLQMEAIAVSMMQLSEQSQAIGQIMAVVEDLASQSTLLAVNAAIEAAKAGEHGKGFTVVAQEVKSLAEQSRAATNQVRTILSDIQKATTAAVLATEQGSKAVEAGEKQTALAGESIQSLADSVTQAAQAATQIAASSQQQLVGVDQVAGAMESIKQASTQNVTSANQLEISARNLNDLGQRLKKMIDRYRF